MPKIVQKVWGSEEWLVNSDLYCVKILRIMPGFMCSLHYHPIKDETFYVTNGNVLLEVGDCTYELAVGDSERILPSTPHRFRSVGKYSATILEASTHHDDADVVRIEESRKICLPNSTNTLAISPLKNPSS